MKELNSDSFSELSFGISEREKEILILICDQLTGKEIAAQLKISERTVIRHKVNLLEKTGCVSQVGLAVFAIKTGIKKIG